MDQTSESNALEARAELQPVQTPAGDQPPVSVKHTYPDGCEVFGVAPFPEMSPLQMQAKALRDATPPQDTVAREEAAKAERADRERQAAAIDAAAREEAAKAPSLPSGIVTADQLAQSPDAPSDTPAA